MDYHYGVHGPWIERSKYTAIQSHLTSTDLTESYPYSSLTPEKRK